MLRGMRCVNTSPKHPLHSWVGLSLHTYIMCLQQTRENDFQGIPNEDPYSPNPTVSNIWKQVVTQNIADTEFSSSLTLFPVRHCLHTWTRHDGHRDWSCWGWTPLCPPGMTSQWSTSTARHSAGLRKQTYWSLRHLEPGNSKRIGVFAIWNLEKCSFSACAVVTNDVLRQKLLKLIKLEQDFQQYKSNYNTFMTKVAPKSRNGVVKSMNLSRRPVMVKLATAKSAF